MLLYHSQRSGWSSPFTDCASMNDHVSDRTLTREHTRADNGGSLVGSPHGFLAVARNLNIRTTP